MPNTRRSRAPAASRRTAVVRTWHPETRTATILKRSRLRVRSPAQVLQAARALVDRPPWTAWDPRVRVQVRSYETPPWAVVSLDYAASPDGRSLSVDVRLSLAEMTTLLTYLLAEDVVQFVSLFADMPELGDDGEDEALPVPTRDELATVPVAPAVQ